VKVLALNCGSSSLKFRLSETPADPSGTGERLAWGSVEGVGHRGRVDFATLDGATMRASVEIAHHGAAMDQTLKLLGERGLAADIEAVGHRIVDGGARFAAPTLVDDEITSAMNARLITLQLGNGCSAAAPSGPDIRWTPRWV